MPDPKAPEPYQVFDVGGGVQAPFYILQFDKQGRPENPQTRRQMLDRAVSTGGVDPYTDIFVFSHGWNNDWKGATHAYDEFIRGFAVQRQAAGGIGRDYRPLLVGAFWPSTALVFPWERAPKMAAPDLAAEQEQQAALSAVLQELAAGLPADRAARFYALAASPELTDEAEQREFAGLMAAAYAGGGTDEVPGGDDGAVAGDDVLGMWREQGRLSAAPAGSGGAPRPVAGQPGGPAIAGGLPLDPRQAIRMFTVWQMKDRAGTVGFKGLGPVVRELLASSRARVHLIGHSFGCKVCLSALCSGPVSRPVDSVLLMQPAISARCFAENARDGRPGGFRVALERTRQPILSTFSKHDFPLTQAFHLAVRRADDCGELRIAGALSPFAALGGFGADGCKSGECVVTPLRRVAEGTYPLDQAGVRIFCLQGDAIIGGHGDVSNEATWWALLQQAKAN
jgi:hypothetical protein